MAVPQYKKKKFFYRIPTKLIDNALHLRYMIVKRKYINIHSSTHFLKTQMLLKVLIATMPYFENEEITGRPKIYCGYKGTQY